MAVVTVLTYQSSDLGDILWYGDVSKTLRFWIHEAGHAIDRNINPGSNDDYSSM
jgi:hypothetical protein